MQAQSCDQPDFGVESLNNLLSLSLNLYRILLNA